MYCQENKFGGRSYLMEPVGSRNSVEYGHGYIQHNYIWLESSSFDDQVPSIICGPYYVKVGFQETDDPVENGWVIIGNEYSRPSQGQALLPDNVSFGCRRRSSPMPEWDLQAQTLVPDSACANYENLQVCSKQQIRVQSICA